MLPWSLAVGKDCMLLHKHSPFKDQVSHSAKLCMSQLSWWGQFPLKLLIFSIWESLQKLLQLKNNSWPHQWLEWRRSCSKRILWNQGLGWTGFVFLAWRDPEEFRLLGFASRTTGQEADIPCRTAQVHRSTTTHGPRTTWPRPSSQTPTRSQMPGRPHWYQSLISLPDTLEFCFNLLSMLPDVATCKQMFMISNCHRGLADGVITGLWSSGNVLRTAFCF